MCCDPKARALKVLPISPAEKGALYTQKQQIFVPTTLAGILVVVVVQKYVEGRGEVRKK